VSGVPLKQAYPDLRHQDELLEFEKEIPEMHLPFERQAFTFDE